MTTTWNYGQYKCYGGRKDAVLQRGGRSAKQHLSAKRNEHVALCYIRIQLDSSDLCQQLEGRHEICNWEG